MLHWEKTESYHSHFFYLNLLKMSLTQYNMQDNFDIFAAKDSTGKRIQNIAFELKTGKECER